MSFEVLSAYYGDSQARKNVIKSIKEAIQRGDSEIVASNSLIPFLEATETIELTQEEMDEARREAEKQCGNANDSNCIRARSEEFQKKRLKEKEFESQSSANAIKGRRLEMEIMENGKKKTITIPDGNKYPLPEIAGFQLPSLSGTALEGLKIGGTILATFIYVFSIVATYRTFIEGGYTRLGYAATAAAIFIPYSGFFLMFAFFAITTYMKYKINA
jgi:hypothetical protein